MIAQLEDDIRSASAGAVSNKSNTPKADNPAYIMLDAQLNAIDSEMRSLSR